VYVRTDAQFARGNDFRYADATLLSTKMRKACAGGPWSHCRGRMVESATVLPSQFDLGMMSGPFIGSTKVPA